MERIIVELDPASLAKRRTDHYLSYTPDKLEQEGIQLAGSYLGISATFLLTYQETVVLVKALRQIPAIEQATVPDEQVDVPALLAAWEAVPSHFERFRRASLERVELSPVPSDLACHTGHTADQMAQQP